MIGLAWLDWLDWGIGGEREEREREGGACVCMCVRGVALSHPISSSPRMYTYQSPKGTAPLAGYPGPRTVAEAARLCGLAEEYAGEGEKGDGVAGGATAGGAGGEGEGQGPAWRRAAL